MKHIAFDLGAESGRAIVGEVVNNKLQMEELHRFPTKGIKVNGSLRWDIYRLYSEIITGLMRYVKKYGQEICSIGIDTWGVDFAFLDSNGKLISIPYHYRDKKNLGTSAIIEEVIGLEKLYTLTGTQQMEFNTLNQIIAANQNNDKTLDIADKLLFISDILHYFLCGVVKNEFTVATTSNMYNPVVGKWSEEVFDAFNISKKMQADIAHPGEVLGNISKDIALEIGLNPDCKIVLPPAHDTASAVVAAPGFGDNVAFLSSGTWSIAGIEMDEVTINSKARDNNISNGGGAFNKNIFLKNIMGLWIIQQCRKAWLKYNPDLSYADIVELAKEASPFYAYINPDDKRFLNPSNMSYEICEHIKETQEIELSTDDIGQIARIVFESLALKYKYVIKLLSVISNIEISQLNIIGGGIQNKMLTQFTSNALGKKVVAGPIEATAVGNILTQAYGLGEISSLLELRQIVKNTFAPIEYFPDNTQTWEDKYREFCKIFNL